MALRFTWDRKKATTNERKHSVGFVEAATAFGDPLSLTIADHDHSAGEERSLLLGVSYRGRLLVVAHTEQDDTIRIINARRASQGERIAYEEES